MNLRDVLYIPLAIVTLPLWMAKKREGWKERFGKTEPLPPVPQDSRGRVLLHAVSVGEVGALRTLVPLLVAGGANVVVSATTDTGIVRARELFASTCHVVRYPLDFSWSVRRFLDAVRPDAVGLVELELWPNFVDACTARHIPVCVVNGRLSERSFKRYRKIRWLLRRVFASLAFAAVQDEEYRERFECMGVPAEKCIVTGSVKWDNARVEDAVAGAAELARELGIDRTRPLVVAGSTGPMRHGCEEALLHRACPPGVQLLCAPRKQERFDEAAAALPGCVRRSLTRGTGPTPSSSTRPTRFLLDTIGELRQAYSLADVVVVGRSFGYLYGSDPLEPVGLGKLTVIGPSVSDFSSIVATLERDGGVLRATPETLGGVLAQLIANTGDTSEARERGFACIRRNQGSSERLAKGLLGLLTGAQRHGGTSARSG